MEARGPRSPAQQAADALLAQAGHELGNPLAYLLSDLEQLRSLSGAIRAAIDAYRREPRPAARPERDDAERALQSAGGLELLDELVEGLHGGTLRLRDLTRDLLGLAPRDFDEAPLDIAAVLHPLLSRARRSLPPGVELRDELTATRPLRASSLRLEQVFTNLLGNAVDACAPSGGHVRVRSRDTELGVAVEIADSGPGIPETAREQLFTPLFSSKASGSGSGLGLYISRRIIEDHGGSIHYQPGREGGAVFVVCLPGHPSE